MNIDRSTQEQKQSTHHYQVNVSMKPSNLESEHNFQCSICLDIAFKPIVQSCGHIFCFWCVHKAMNSKMESQCPTCRRPYLHFPRICGLLHNFFMKTFPEEYNAKACEIQEMEEGYQVFSSTVAMPTNLKSSLLSLEPDFCYDYSSSSSPSTPSTPNSPIDYMPHHEPNTPSINKDSSIKKAPKTWAFKLLRLESIDDEDNLPIQNDFQCAKCQTLLYKPVVLNCGEVFCQSCLKTSNVKSSPIMCPSCKSPHPGTCLNVCLELDHYIKTIFPLQYNQREIEVSRLCNDENTNLDCEDKDLIGGYFNEGEYHLVHEGVGCDGCGMFPIIGMRYRCKDCHESIGFDLCEKCKNANTLNGRFNQQHTNQHELEEVSTLKSGGIVHARLRHVNQIVPLTLTLDANTTVQRRGPQNQYFQELFFNDLDDYIDSLV